MNDHPVIPWLTQPRRAWLYRVLTALAPLAIVYGVASDAEVAAWVGAVLAVLGTGTAAVHTPRTVSRPEAGHSQSVVGALILALVFLVFLRVFEVI